MHNALNPVIILGTRTASQTIHFISLVQQKLRQIRTILASNASNKRFFHVCLSKMPNVHATILKCVGGFPQ
ncbi:hypothetical protein SDC9_180259 [bioreactor metagenome]|uniref:Uncharacterized protein n=1 Tax=bioreactor metagenome TaxID=1076179 RepID=A0A645H447_9ZZZZ